MKIQTPPENSASQTKKLARQLGRIVREFRVVCLHEQPVGDLIWRCYNTDDAAHYWREFICKSPSFNPEVECLYVLLLNTRFVPKGHHLVATGTRDMILSHPIEVFRPAIIAASAAITLFHNHPSGDSTPSESDICFTRDIIRAGQILKIEVVDHLIMGRKSPSRARDFYSLRAAGYFYDSVSAPTAPKAAPRAAKKRRDDEIKFISSGCY